MKAKPEGKENVGEKTGQKSKKQKLMKQDKGKEGNILWFLVLTHRNDVSKDLLLYLKYRKLPCSESDH